MDKNEAAVVIVGILTIGLLISGAIYTSHQEQLIKLQCEQSEK